MARERLHAVSIRPSSCGRRNRRSVWSAQVFIIGISIFAAASLWCGLAPNLPQLILARAAQGAGAALLLPCSLALIGATFDEAERGRAIGTWAGSSAVATAIAPLLGGWIVDHFSWRWIFLVNPLIALPTIWIVTYHVPESRDPDAKPGLDWRGTILVFFGLGSLAYGLIASPISGWRDPIVLLSLIGGLVLLVAFVYAERRSRTPILPLSLFQSRTFSAVNLLTLLLYAALGGVFFFLPFALIQVHGYPATLAGTVFLPFTIIMAVLSRWGGGLLDRFGARFALDGRPGNCGIGYWRDRTDCGERIVLGVSCFGCDTWARHGGDRRAFDCDGNRCGTGKRNWRCLGNQ
jgi:EmrB/QacA subfamily drug resistance transporter